MDILIVEDEVRIGQRLRKIIEELSSENHVLDMLHGVQESVAWLQQHPMPDVIFLDIQLSDGLSFDIFNHISADIPVIFTTAYDEYALRAFKLNSIDYLLKPVGIEDVSQALEKFRKTREVSSNNATLQKILSELKQQQYIVQPTPQYRRRILFTIGDKLRSAQIEECAYFYTEQKITYVVLHSGAKGFLDCSLDSLEQELEPEIFFRVNRQFIVHSSSIIEIKKMLGGKLHVYVQPRTNKDIIVSRETSPLLKDWLNR